MNALLAYVRESFPEWQASLDEPPDTAGRWFLDLAHPSGRRATVEWRPGQGYGVSAWAADRPPLYGEGHDRVETSIAGARRRLGELLGS